ncbi:MAG: hypothetical protein OEY66_11535 [Gammaproteobacteria bacterium]|nr:hypothetical protein [Gammaproteobacteria bacterium]
MRLVLFFLYAYLYLMALWGFSAILKALNYLDTTILIINNTIDFFSENIISLALNIQSHTPDAKFISDIAGFEAVIIGIAIPLSFDVISRISERYKSDVITTKFLSHWSSKLLLPFLLINIFIAISLRFFHVETNTVNEEFWVVFSWIIYAGFISTALILFYYFRLVQQFAGNTDYIIKELLNEAGKYIHK